MAISRTFLFFHLARYQDQVQANGVGFSLDPAPAFVHDGDFHLLLWEDSEYPLAKSALSDLCFFWFIDLEFVFNWSF